MGIEEEKKYIKREQEICKENRDFLNDHQKMEEEIVKAFLRCCDIEFKCNEIKKIDNDPPDVVYKEAKFEVTEKLDTNRKRDKEYKDKEKTAKTAETPKDFLKSDQPSSVMNSLELFGEIEKSMAQKYEKYRKRQINFGEIDLLVYVNLKNRHLYLGKKETDCPKPPKDFLEKIKKQGWRSVSFVTERHAGVIYCQEKAPDFIKKIKNNNLIKTIASERISNFR